MNNIIVPIDAEDSDDEMAVNRTPKILEQLKLMKKKKLSDRDSRKSATRKKSKNAKNNNVNRNRKKQIFDPNTGKMQDVDEIKKKKKRSSKRTKLATNNNSNGNTTTRDSHKKNNSNKSKTKKKDNANRNENNNELIAEKQLKKQAKRKDKKLRSKINKKKSHVKNINNETGRSLKKAESSIASNTITPTKKSKQTKSKQKANAGNDDEFLDGPHYNLEHKELLEEQERLLEQYKQNAKDKAEAEKKESDNGLSDTQEISQNTLSKDHESSINDQKEVPENLLKVWGEGQDAKSDVTYPNRSTSISPSSWQQESTWGKPTGGYFDALFVNQTKSMETSSSLSSDSLHNNNQFNANTNNGMNNPYLNFNQQGYYSSINSMIGNMHLNPMVPDAQQQNNHEADFSEFRNSMLGISNESIYENNDTDRISKLRSDSKDSGNVSFDETQLLGTFLDSPNMTPKKGVPKQNIEENLEL